MASPPTFNLRQEDIPEVEGVDKLIVALGRFAQQTQLAFSNDITFTDNIKCQVVDVDITLKTENIAIAPIPPWTLYEVSSADAYHSPPILRKIDGGVVVLHGLIASGDSGTVALQVPVNYRPKKRVAGVSYGRFGDIEAAFRWEVLPSGEVKVGVGVENGISCVFYHLHCWWIAENPTPVANAIFPYRVKLDLPSQLSPIGVQVFRAIEITADAKEEKAVGKALSVDWDVDENYLLIKNIPGLVDSKRYKVKLVILGG